MSDMQEMIIDTTTKIFRDHCTKEVIDQAEEGIFAQELWNVLVESGIPSVGFPESLGGTGGDYEDALHIFKLAGKYAAPLPLGETWMVKWLLANEGVRVPENKLTFAVDSRNNFKIEGTSEDFTIKGKAINVPWARHAEKILILGQKEGKSVIYMVPLEGANIQYGSNLAGEPRDTVIFEDTHVGDVFLQEVDEKRFIKQVTNLGGLVKAMTMAGAMESVLELSIQYTKDREQFGRPLYRLQAVQQHLAILSGETAASVTMSDKAAAVFNREEFSHEIAAAKLKVNESSRTITEIAHQVHGAIGVTHEHRLHQLTRRLWAWRDEFGNEDYWAAVLAEKMMNSTESNLWDMITDQPTITVEK